MNERTAQILDLVTSRYIREAHPVASAVIAEELGVSSATVRNELSALEEAGYLQQPHTSAGRIPTSLGYSHYARKFIPPRRLPYAQQRLLEHHLRGMHGDSLLQRVASLAAELSGYAVVVSLPGDDTLCTLEIHLSVLSSTKLLAVVVLETGLIRQLLVDLSPTPSAGVLREAESSLRQLTLPLALVPEALQDIARRTEEELARTLHALAAAWPGLTPPQVIAQGLKNLLTEPESHDPNFVRLAFERLEGTLPANPNPEASLRIMLEETLALVSTPLHVGTSYGGLMLVGPLRMRYPETLMIAQGITETVAQMLVEDAADESLN